MSNVSHAATIVQSHALRGKFVLCDCGEQFEIEPTASDPWYSPEWDAHCKRARKANKSRRSA